ncbi:MAG: hypothetical protein ACRDGG_00145 [Anaerolineae bacterium]
MVIKRIAVILVGMAVGAAETFGIVSFLGNVSKDPLLLMEFGAINFVLAAFMFGMIAVIALDAILKTDLLK